MRDELSIYFENPATDPLGHNALEGKVFCDDSGVTIRYKEKDRAFRKTDPSFIQLSYAEIETASYTSKFFGPKLFTLTTRGTDILKEIPGADVGKVILHVVKDSRDEAAKAAEFIEYKQSEAFLKERDDRLSDSRDSL